MKKLMTIIFLGIYSLTALSSDISSLDLKAIEGHYEGVTIYKDESCAVDIKIKKNKIRFTVTSEDIYIHRVNKAPQKIPSYSSALVALEQFHYEESVGTLSYSKLGGLSPDSYYTWVTFSDQEISSVALSEVKSGLLDFYKPYRFEVEARCYQLKKVR